MPPRRCFVGQVLSRSDLTRMGLFAGYWCTVTDRDTVEVVDDLAAAFAFRLYRDHGLRVRTRVVNEQTGSVHHEHGDLEELLPGLSLASLSPCRRA